MPYSIIIPSRNIDNLRACVGALRAAGETARIIVVDDGIKGTIDEGFRFAAKHEPIEVVIGERPFIFARNCNFGIRAAGDDDIVICNDDALVALNGLGALRDYCQDEYGIVGATTNVTGYPAQWRYIRGKTVREVNFLAFVCVYIPRRVLNVVGLLDERFGGIHDGKPIYGGDDVDYCLRVREAGLKVGVSDYCYVDHSKLKSTFRGAHPGNGAPGDIKYSNVLGIEKWGDKWPHR